MRRLLAELSSRITAPGLSIFVLALLVIWLAARSERLEHRIDELRAQLPPGQFNFKLQELRP